MPQPKVNRRGVKPRKPYPEFPLYAHAAGVWAKRIRAHVYYFGPWDDPNGAFDRYMKQRDRLHAGQALPPETQGATLHELVNFYIDSQKMKMESGHLTPRHYEDCRRAGKLVLETLGRHRPVAGLLPSDYAQLRLAVLKDRKATSARGVIIRIRCIFSWGKATGYLDGPPKYGKEFSTPSASAIRLALAASPSRQLFDPQSLRKLIKAAKGHPRLLAMILLGVNVAYGNTDCAVLDLRDVHLDAKIVDLPRQKTGVQRRAVLWPETVKALKAVIGTRTEGRVFTTRRGRPYVSRNAKGTELDAITTQFRKLMQACGVYRKGLGFYCLRRTFRTIADETKDFPACDLVMGHIAGDAAGAPFAVEMAGRYRITIGIDRLQAIADHVHKWLFGKPQGKASK